MDQMKGRQGDATALQGRAQDARATSASRVSRVRRPSGDRNARAFTRTLGTADMNATAKRFIYRSADDADRRLAPSHTLQPFAAIWQSVSRMAATIDNMPDSCMPKSGLRTRLQDAAWQSMRCPQDRYEAMLAMPANAVRRVGSFAVDGQALNAINSVAAHVDRIKQEVDDGMHGYARDARNNHLTDGYDSQQWGSRQYLPHAQ